MKTTINGVDVEVSYRFTDGELEIKGIWTDQDIYDLLTDKDIKDLEEKCIKDYEQQSG